VNVLLRRFAALALACCLGPPVWASNGLAGRVRALYEEGEYERAVQMAETAPAPRAEVIFYHGLALARLERFEQARLVFRRGRELYPRDKRFPLELAGVSYLQDDLSGARAFLHKALKIDPADEYGADFLGALYLLEGDLPAALTYWNRIDKPVIHNVTLRPQPRLHPLLRERAVSISGGQILTLHRLRTAQAHLGRLDVFARRTFELQPREDDRFGLAIRLLPREPPLRGWLGRLLPAARGLPYEAVHFDRYNIAGRAMNLESLWRWDPRKRRIGLELSGPFRLKPRIRYRFGVDARDEDWALNPAFPAPAEAPDSFKLRKIALGGGFVFAINERLAWSTGLRLTRRTFQDAGGTAAFADSWSFEQRNQLDYRLLDRPVRRIRVDSSARLRTGRVFSGASSRFAIIEGDLDGSWRPRLQEDAWRARARLRAGKTFGGIPFDEFFQLGMQRDNDLWLRGHAGTRDGVKGRAPLGTEYALVQTELDRRIGEFRFFRVSAGPFFDAGNIGGRGGFGSRGWLFDAGVQVKASVAGGFTWSFVYGRDLRAGQGVFYTAVEWD